MLSPLGDLNRITDDEAAVGFSDLTAEGNLLVFTSNRSGSRHIWGKDLTTGKEFPITGGRADVTPTVAPDGSKLAYHTSDEKANYVVTTRATRANPRSRRKIVELSGWSYSWSGNGEWLFYAMRAERWGVEASHVSSGRKYIVFQHPGYDLTYFHPSPDNRWAVASAFEYPLSRIQIAPLREGTTIEPREWFSIADDAAQHDRPMWSSDGTLVYHTSYRDGFRCIWAQRLHTETKRPSGPPVPVYHSHSARISLRNAGQDGLKISVTRDKLVFNMGELRGNIWMAALPN